MKTNFDDAATDCRRCYGTPYCGCGSPRARENNVLRFPDGEPVSGFRQPKAPGGSAFVLIICVLLSGAVVLGYMAMHGCAVIP